MFSYIWSSLSIDRWIVEGKDLFFTFLFLLPSRRNCKFLTFQAHTLYSCSYFRCVETGNRNFDATLLESRPPLLFPFLLRLATVPSYLCSGCWNKHRWPPCLQLLACLKICELLPSTQPCGQVQYQKSWQIVVCLLFHQVEFPRCCAGSQTIKTCCYGKAAWLAPSLPKSATVLHWLSWICPWTLQQEASLKVSRIGQPWRDSVQLQSNLGLSDLGPC